MAWENIEGRLERVFKVRISFPDGSVSLPDTHLNIDEWLTSLAETDEELKELNIPRIQFLQNRWRIEKLLELEWDSSSASSAICAMYVGRRAYILFSDGFNYQLIARIEPKGKAPLYRAVIGKLLQNPSFVPESPTIKNHRPDLIPDVEDIKMADWVQDEDWLVTGSEGGSKPGKAAPKEGYLSKLLVGWIGKWIDLPVLGYWHEGSPDSITTRKGQYVMKYKPTYGDKQREEQKRLRQEELRNRPTQPESEEKQSHDDSQPQEDRPGRKGKRVA